MQIIRCNRCTVLIKAFANDQHQTVQAQRARDMSAIWLCKGSEHPTECNFMRTDFVCERSSSGWHLIQISLPQCLSFAVSAGRTLKHALNKHDAPQSSQSCDARRAQCKCYLTHQKKYLSWTLCLLKYCTDNPPSDEFHRYYAGAASL